MSARYELVRADTEETPTDIIHPDDFEETFGEGPARSGDYALTIGDPWNSAYALTGNLEELQAFVVHLAGLVQLRMTAS